jgi:DNA-binding GntR family transcriptional regulator
LDLLTLPKVERHLSLTDSVHAMLRAAIVENHLAVGSRLTEASIAAQLGVSNTPVREAISRLEREGLVQHHPRRGAVVASIAAEDVAEVLEIRELLEAHAIGRAIERRTAELEQRLQEVVVACEELVRARELRGFTQLDLEFHRLLVQASGNSRLVRVFETMQSQFLMIRWRVFDLPDRPLAGHVEHKDILAAFLAGDAAAAERAVRWHHHHTKQDLLTALEAAGGSFGG